MKKITKKDSAKFSKNLLNVIQTNFHTAVFKPCAYNENRMFYVVDLKDGNQLEIVFHNSDNGSERIMLHTCLLWGKDFLPTDFQQKFGVGASGKKNFFYSSLEIAFEGYLNTFVSHVDKIINELK